MKKNTIVLMIIIAGSCLTAFAQYDYDDEDFGKRPPKPPKERSKFFCNLGYGGSLGFAASNNNISFGIQPIIAYRPIDMFELGIGFGYQFNSYTSLIINGYLTPLPVGERLSLHAFSITGFPRVYVWRELFLQATYEHLISDEVTGITLSPSGRIAAVEKQTGNFNTLFVGGGYNFSIGGRGFFTLNVAINVLQNYVYPRYALQPGFGFLFYPCRESNN